MNLNDMFSSAADAPDDSFGDLLGPKDMEDGTVVLAKITYSKAGTTKAGAPSWTNKLEVVEEGPLKGGEFFDSVYLSNKTSDGARSYNKRQFAKLGAAGLDANFFSANPSADAVAAHLKGKFVRVIVKWQEPGDDGRQFGEHSWTPAEAATAGGPEGFSASSPF